MKIKSFIIGISLGIFATSCAQQKIKEIAIEKLDEPYQYEVVVPELETPWGMAFLPSGGILVTEKRGELLLVENGITTSIQNVPNVSYRGQGGLLDVELHPNFNENHWVYLSYASPEGEETGAHTAIARGQLKGNSLENFEVLYKASPNTRGGNHFGSRIEFDNEGYLYFTIGERDIRDVNPQDITRDGGKVYRLHDDGSIPKDNPFVNTPNAKPAIYSYGHRNPQGMAIHPKTGKIWTGEHGPQGGDEINEIRPGNNYGWPVICYGVNYGGAPITDKTHEDGMEQPIYYWVPSIAPCGIDFVTSDKYPEWQNSLLVSSLKFQYLEFLKLENDRVVKREKILEDIGRVRCVRQAPDGYVYVAVEGVGIVKITPKN